MWACAYSCSAGVCTCLSAIDLVHGFVNMHAARRAFGTSVLSLYTVLDVAMVSLHSVVCTTSDGDFSFTRRAFSILCLI